MFQRAREGKQKQQHCPFAPRANARATNRHGQHQEMNVERAILQRLTNFLRGKPSSGYVCRNIRQHTPWLVAPKISGEPETRAKRCREQFMTRFMLMLVFREMH